jgi:hypothetical protein
MQNDPTLTTALDAAAETLAAWLGLAWEGLHDSDISGDWPDWSWNGIGQKQMQGGRPALRRVAQKMMEAARARA